MNDYLTDAKTCPEEPGKAGEYTLNSCKAEVFDRNGIRYDQLQYIQLMEAKYARIVSEVNETQS